jgi:hypothetical protein
LKYNGKTLWTKELYLKYEWKECKTGPFRWWVLVRGGRQMERKKKGEHGLCPLCTCMKIE